MKYNKLYRGGGRESFNDKLKNEIELLDKKNGNLLASDILYTFIDLIDEDIIRIDDITKIYKLDEAIPNSQSTRTTSRRYITYEIRIRVKILNKNEIEKYVDFREGFFNHVMSDVYKHHILNRDCTKPYYDLKDINNRRSTFRRVDDFEDGYVYDNFDLIPKFIEFIDK